MAKIANVALTNTFNTWRTNSNQAFDRLSQFAINNSSLYANTLTANTAFTSKGTTNLGDGTGDLTTITGRTTIGTNLTVSGNTSTNKLTVTNSLTSSGNTSLGDGVADITTITGTVSVSKNLAVSGNTTSNKLTVTNLLTSSGNTALGDAAADVTTITGTASVSKNLAVSGNTSTNKLTVTNSLTSSGNTALGDGVADITTITGTASVSKNLAVSGNTSTNKLTATSSLTSSGNTTISGLFANGSLGSANFLLKSTGTSTFWAAAGASGATIVNDTSTATNIFPLMATATSGSALTINTSNSKLLYKPSTGEFAASALVANNGLMVNSANVTSSYTIPAKYNAMSAGPISIANGVVITITAGQRWIIL